MEKKINNFYQFVDKVGKRNILLGIFVLFILVLIGLYTTFSIYTFTDEVSIVDGLKTYIFILNSENVENSITIAKGAEKNVAITVSNGENADLQYGIYYTSASDLTDVSLGYLKTSEYLSKGIIEPNSDYVVTIKISNNSSSDVTINLGLIYGFENGGDLELGSGQYWLDEYDDGSVSTVVDVVTSLFDYATKDSVTTAGGETIEEVSSLGLMEDSFGNIRYYGENPDNYVSFNEELWRIIGVFDVEDEEGNIEKRVKIVRNDSIGTFVYDNSTFENGVGVNDWSVSRLMMLLNPGYESEDVGGSLYWNSEAGTCYAESNLFATNCSFVITGLSEEAKSLIGQAKYYLGGGSIGSGLYANDYYGFERGTTVYSNHATEWTGYVGLIYPSDYAYATDLNLCKEETYNYGLDMENCLGTNWLYSDSYVWTISPYSSSSEAAFLLLAGGSMGDSYYVYISNEVFPVLYLNSDVVVDDGDGSEDDPYQLSVISDDNN